MTEVQQMQTKDEDDAWLGNSVQPESGWHDSNPAKVTDVTMSRVTFDSTNSH